MDVPRHPMFVYYDRQQHSSRVFCLASFFGVLGFHFAHQLRSRNIAADPVGAASSTTARARAIAVTVSWSNSLSGSRTEPIRTRAARERHRFRKRVPIVIGYDLRRL